MSAHGVLVVNKPRGPTSHDVVAAARRLLGTRSVGHAGTLNPMASGVLVLLVGEATKLASYLTLDDKEYRASIAFGRATDTLDAEGQTTEERPVPDGALAKERVQAALDAESQRTEQVPPVFSAISVGGQRAHRLSRRGKTVVLEPRPVVVRALELLGIEGHTVEVRLAVSKGYYVRSFARDLGERLGVPAHLSGLVRLASGPYRVENALGWPPALDALAVQPLAEAARTALPSARLTEEGVSRASTGKLLTPEHFAAQSAPSGDGAGSVAAWLDGNDRLVALGQPDGAGSFRVVRGFTRTIDEAQTSVKSDR